MRHRFIINGKAIDIDDQERYYSVVDVGDQRPPKIIKIDFLAMLMDVADGRRAIDDKLRAMAIYLERWTIDAPRRRMVRRERREGPFLITIDVVFDSCSEEERNKYDYLFAGLENTGRVAAQLLDAIGLNGRQLAYGRSSLASERSATNPHP